MYFPCAIYATDVTFQQCNRPIGHSGEQNPFYSGKHDLHGLKLVVPVNPRGFAINRTNFAKVSVADIQVLRHNLEFHQTMRIMTGQDLALEDCGPMKAQLLQEWAILADKGY